MGPLAGLTIIEIAGIGPGPFAAMSLADMGAEVIRVERPAGGLFADQQTNPRLDLLNRGKRCIAIDLKTAEGVETVLKMVARADALLEFLLECSEEHYETPLEHSENQSEKTYDQLTEWFVESGLIR